MKILFVNAPPLKKFGIVGQIYPPLGILYLASYLRSRTSGFELKVLDGYQDRDPGETCRKILAFSPDILAVSFTTQAATGACEVIRVIRERKKDIRIITGGPHPTICPEEPLRSGADIVVRGEGEITFSELADRIRENRDWSDVAGIAFRKNGTVRMTATRPLIKDLDTIPFPARDLVDLRSYPGYHYKKSGWDTSYLSGRGCPYNCVYCSNPVWKLQRPWMRLRSPANIAEEIEELRSRYGVREFYDQTDLFNADLHWAKDVCSEFIRRRLDILWKVQMTVQNMDDDLADRMVRSGCWLGLLGIETGNDVTASGINKRTSRTTATRSLGILKKHGMKTLGLFMAFNVWEEDGVVLHEDARATAETLRFAAQLARRGKLDLMTWSLTTPYPGSCLFDIARRHGLIPEEMEGKWEFWDSSENLVMRLSGVSWKDWLSLRRRGKILQALLLLKSGTFSMRSLGVYLRKLRNLLKRGRGAV